MSEENVASFWQSAHQLEAGYTHAHAAADRKTIRLITSPDDGPTPASMRAFLQAFAGYHRDPWVTFGLVGTPSSIYPCLSAPAEDIEALQQHILAFFPNTAFDWHDPAGDLTGAEFRLVTSWRANPGAWLIGTPASFTPDPLTALIAGLERLQVQEAWSLAIAFRRGYRDSWVTSGMVGLPQADAVRAKTLRHYTGQPEQPNIAKLYEQVNRGIAAQKQSALPTWDVDIYTIATSPNQQRLAQMQNVFAQHFAAYNLFWEHTGETFGLVPADPMARLPGYELWERNLFNCNELAGLMHVPSKSVVSPILLRTTQRLKPAPAAVTGPEGLLLGVNEYYGTTKNVRLPSERRSQHAYIIGAAGSGKSTLLANLIKQDIMEGRGCAVIDPHGDLVTELLHHIPEHRVADTVYFNAADRDFPVSLNPLTADSEPEVEAVTADFMVLFQRLFAVGDAYRMLHILRHAVLTLLTVGGKTFGDIRRMLTSGDFRQEIVEQLSDPELIEFWTEEFPALPRSACDPIINKLSPFTLNKTVRNISGSRKTRSTFSI